jgi:hypothetical protein
MIKINYHKGIWINIVLFTVFLVSLIKLGLQIKYMTVGRGVYFGYENTLIWDASVSLFWLFWLIGCTGLILNRGWSFIFIFPPSILSILVCVATFQKAIYKTIDVQIMTYLGLVLSTILLIYINRPSVKKEIGFSNKSYLLGAIFLVAFTILFYSIDQK